MSSFVKHKISMVSHESFSQFLFQVWSYIQICFCFYTLPNLPFIDTQLKPILSYNHIQSRSVILQWEISGKHLHDFDYFLIYYRRVNHFQIDDWFSRNDYQQIVIHPRFVNKQFTYRVWFFFVKWWLLEIFWI